MYSFPGSAPSAIAGGAPPDEPAAAAPGPIPGEGSDRQLFEMYFMKVTQCPRRCVHDWSTCVFAHTGEKARRRDPRTHSYTGICCTAMKAEGRCSLGDACPFAHNDFEYWLHPTRYHTALCKQGPACQRKICFFAHHPSELRPRIPPGAGAAAAAAAAAMAQQQQQRQRQQQQQGPAAAALTAVASGASQGSSAGRQGGGGSSTHDRGSRVAYASEQVARFGRMLRAASGGTLPIIASGSSGCPGAYPAGTVAAPPGMQGGNWAPAPPPMSMLRQSPPPTDGLDGVSIPYPSAHSTLQPTLLRAGHGAAALADHPSQPLFDARAAELAQGSADSSSLSSAPRLEQARAMEQFRPPLRVHREAVARPGPPGHDYGSYSLPTTPTMQQSDSLANVPSSGFACTEGSNQVLIQAAANELALLPDQAVEQLTLALRAHGGPLQHQEPGSSAVLGPAGRSGSSAGSAGPGLGGGAVTAHPAWMCVMFS